MKREKEIKKYRTRKEGDGKKKKGKGEERR